MRITVAGLLWAVAYNLLWAAAWFGFMRHEWHAAAEAAGQSMPWTPQFWLIWIPMTVPFGMAVAAYLLGRRDRRELRRAALAASMVVWVPGTIGMAFGAALTVGIIVLDSVVNLFATLIPSALLAEVLRRHEDAWLEDDHSGSAS